MKEIDYKPLVTDDPVADAEYYASREPDVVGYCEACGSPIYKGLNYIEIQGVRLHDEYECKLTWLEQFKVIG